MFKINLKLKKDIRFPKIISIPIKKQKNVLLKINKFIHYRRNFRIIEHYIFWCKYLEKFIFLPKNFIFDGASVPKSLNNIYGSTGILFYGAAPHDFGYRYNGLFLVDDDNRIYFQKFNKKELDTIFKELCLMENGMKKISELATFTLKLFGFISWRSHRKKSKKVEDDYPKLFI